MQRRNDQLNDGKWFKSSRAAKKHVFRKFCTMKDRTNSTQVWQEGDICGNPVALTNLHGCRAFVLDHSEQVTVQNAKNCKIYVGACCSTIFVRGCSNCEIYGACKQMYLSDCESMRVNLFSLIGPSIQRSKKIVFSHFTMSFPKAFEAWMRAELYPFTRSQQRAYRSVTVSDAEKGTSRGDTYFVEKPRGSKPDFNVSEALPFVVGNKSASLSEDGAKPPEPPKSGPDEDPSSNPMLDTFKVGQQVEARFRGKRYWFRGRITSKCDSRGSKYDVVYSDGDSEKGVLSKYIRVYVPKLVPSYLSNQFSESFVVRASVAETWAGLTDKTLTLSDSEAGMGAFKWKVRYRSDRDHEMALEGDDHAAIVKMLPVTIDGSTFVDFTVDCKLGTKPEDEKRVASRFASIASAIKLSLGGWR